MSVQEHDSIKKMLSWKNAFGRIMQEQVEVQAAGEQTRELLFKTRQFVTDASPKSRSMMMIYLDSMDLFESSLLSYQNYELLHRNLKETGFAEPLLSRHPLAGGGDRTRWIQNSVGCGGEEKRRHDCVSGRAGRCHRRNG